MSTAWDTHHQRAAALRRVIARLDSGTTHELPWDDDLARVFACPGDVLLGLHGAWQRRLLGRVDLALEIDAHSLEESVAQAWHETASELPGVRRLLDRHSGHEVLTTSLRHEHRMLAVAAGLAALADPAGLSAEAGERFVDQIRGTPAASPRAGRLTAWLAALVS